MGFKSNAIKPYAKFLSNRIKSQAGKPFEYQKGVFGYLIEKGQGTKFGNDHDFKGIQNHSDFMERVPIRDYEGLKNYVEEIRKGESNILWPGKPAYLAKTSGTTSGTKYIPLTRASIPNHLNTARNALMMYVAESNDASVFEGKLIFLSGSPILNRSGKIPTGRLSGIVNHHVPKWAKSNQMPTYETNCIEDWEEKVDRIVDETLHADMRLISGIPPWVLMYYEKIMEITGKPIIRNFPNLKVFVHGGVNFQPYQSKLEEAVGKKIPMIETYPASEGFIAFQDSQYEEGLLLNINSGIFYEFILLEDFHGENPPRITLEEVELGKQYIVIINNNAGLWGYNIGDTVKFVSKSPYRLIVTGRVKHFISAFGEHVIAHEVEQALLKAASQFEMDIVEFTVAPQVSPEEGLPYHEWFIEFGKKPGNINELAKTIDGIMREQNVYYDDLIRGNVLQPLKITELRPNAFREMMQAKGKLGGQNKVPRLKNDREIALELSAYTI